MEIYLHIRKKKKKSEAHNPKVYCVQRETAMVISFVYALISTLCAVVSQMESLKRELADFGRDSGNAG